jgi:hypothetical protein
MRRPATDRGPALRVRSPGHLSPGPADRAHPGAHSAGVTVGAADAPRRGAPPLRTRPAAGCRRPRSRRGWRRLAERRGRHRGEPPGQQARSSQQNSGTFTQTSVQFACSPDPKRWHRKQPPLSLPPAQTSPADPYRRRVPLTAPTRRADNVASPGAFGATSPARHRRLGGGRRRDRVFKSSLPGGLSSNTLYQRTA